MRWLVIVSLGLMTVPAVAKPPEPALMIRARSITDMLALAEYVGGLADQGETAKQIAILGKALTNRRTGLEGIDTSRPIGFYASITEDVAGSPVVLMIPVADEKTFVNLLKRRLNLDVEPLNKGGYSITIPQVPVPVYFAVHDGVAYVTAITPSAIDDDARIKPADFFADFQADAPLIGLMVRPDRLPPGVVDAVLTQTELKMVENEDERQEGESAGDTAARRFGQQLSLDVFRSMLVDGRSLAVELRIEPKTDDIKLDVVATPLPRTPFAAFARSLAERAGQVVPVVDDAFATVRVNVALPPEARKSWAKTLVTLLADKDSPDDKLALDAFRPSLEAGVFDLAATVAGEEAAYKIAGALGVVEGGNIAKALKQADKDKLGPYRDASTKSAFDAATVGPVTLHTVRNPNVKPVVGTDSVWLGTASDRLLLTIDPSRDTSEKFARAAAALVPTPGPAVDVSLAAVRLATLNPDDNADALEAVQKVFGEASLVGKDTISLKVIGGEAITTSFRIKGRAVKFFIAQDQARKARVNDE